MAGQAKSVTSCAHFLSSLGADRASRATSAFDPGYDPATVEQHLVQSGHVLRSLKISMSCWLVGAEGAVKRKTAAAKAAGVPTVAGGGPFEIAYAQGLLEEYLELCSAVGLSRIEVGEGFAAHDVNPQTIVPMARAHSLGVEYEMGGKHSGRFKRSDLGSALTVAERWLDAGAEAIVVEARESARDVGVFSEPGSFNKKLAASIVDSLGFNKVVFEAPDKASQFALIEHFGADVQLSNVRLEEILRVEIYRRGLHSDAYANERLRPRRR